MSALGTVARVVAALAVGLGASFFIGQWWSPVCHEGCPRPIVIGMWGLLLALPLALAASVARERPLARVGMTLAVFAVLGVAITVVAAWLQGHPQGG